MRRHAPTACILAALTTCLGGLPGARAAEPSVAPAPPAAGAADLAGDWQFVQFWMANGALARIAGTTRLERRADGDLDARFRWTKEGREDTSLWRGSVRGGVLWAVHAEKPTVAFALGQGGGSGCLLGVLFHSARGASVSGLGLCRAPARTDEAVLGGWSLERGTRILAALTAWLGPDLPPAFLAAWSAWKTAYGGEPVAGDAGPLAVARLLPPVEPAPDPIPNVLEHPVPMGWTGKLTCPAGSTQKTEGNESGCVRPDGRKEGPWVRAVEGRIKSVSRYVDGEEVEESSWNLERHGPSEYERSSDGERVTLRRWRDGVLREECDTRAQGLRVCTQYNKDGTRHEYSEACFDQQRVWRKWNDDGSLSVDRQNDVDCEALALAQALGKRVFEALQSGRLETLADCLPVGKDLPDLATRGIVPGGSPLETRVKAGDLKRELLQELREVRDEAARDGVNWASARYRKCKTDSRKNGPVVFHVVTVALVDGSRTREVRIEAVVRSQRGLLVLKGFDWVK